VECTAWLFVPKQTTFSFGKNASEHYFLNENNFKLTNKRFRLSAWIRGGVRTACMAFERVSYFTISLKFYMNYAFKYCYFQYNLLNKRTFSNWYYEATTESKIKLPVNNFDSNVLKICWPWKSRLNALEHIHVPILFEERICVYKWEACISNICFKTFGPIQRQKIFRKLKQ